MEGGVLVIAVLLLLLGNVPGGLIVASAIPLSMLFAFTGMVQAGLSGDLISLGAIDFGLIVDGSIGDDENIVRKVSERQRPGATREDVIREAGREVARPVFFAVLIIMIVYLPILTLEGVEGKMFRPMALTVVFALIGSPDPVADSDACPGVAAVSGQSQRTRTAGHSLAEGALSAHSRNHVSAPGDNGGRRGWRLRTVDAARTLHGH